MKTGGGRGDNRTSARSKLKDDGLNDPQIAATLCRFPRTIHSHRDHLFI